jgi:hypothetical protein
MGKCIINIIMYHEQGLFHIKEMKRDDRREEGRR